MKKICIILLLGICVLASACQEQPRVAKATYVLVLQGQVKESGVIQYLDKEMNVYQDFRSNPCGDCQEQPVSVYVGATAPEVTAALAKAIQRADDIWVVKEVQDARLVLEEKNPGEGVKPAEPSAPAGLRIQGTFVVD